MMFQEQPVADVLQSIGTEHWLETDYKLEFETLITHIDTLWVNYVLCFQLSSVYNLCG